MKTRISAAAAALALVLLGGGAWLWSRGAPASSTTPGGPVPVGSPPTAEPSVGTAASPDLAPRPGAGTPSAALEGSVVDALTGAAIPGAELTFARAEGASSARSGPDGRFQFGAPEPGSWRLAAVTARGYLPFAPEWGHSPITFDARPGRTVRGLTIRLSAALPMEGIVLGPDGEPVVGADVRLLGALLEAALVPVADRLRSGPGGRFSFVAPEGTVVEATAAGLLPGRAEVDFLARAQGTVTVRLQEEAHPLPAPAPIGGTVVGSRGEPVGGALVTASRELGYGVADATSAALLSGPDGRFLFDDLGPGHWRVTARLAGRIPGSARRVAPGTQDLVLRLAEGGRLRGCATDAATGEPIPTLTVHLLDVRTALRVVARESRSSIDPSGCYQLDGLDPGPVRVIVSAPGYAPSAPADVTIPEPGTGEAVADVRLAAGGRLTGVVTSEATGAPIEGARVALEGQLEPATSAIPSLAEAATDAEGRFTLTGLPRRSSIMVAAAGHHARIVGGIEAPSGGTVGPLRIALRPAAPDEEPRVDLAGIGVSLTPHGDAFTITGVLAEGGAARAGLARGDEIVGVDGRTLLELGGADAIEAIRGPEGTIVTITVRRNGRTEEVRVTRTVVRG